jgi:hypothetical protein
MSGVRGHVLAAAALGTPIGNVNDNQLWGADWGILR